MTDDEFERDCLRRFHPLKAWLLARRERGARWWQFWK